ncbi:hypothetical protein BGZ73_002504, partial [Actinomortierella ambigua]
MAVPLLQFHLPEQFIRTFKPERFDGRARGSKAEDWFQSVERYCSALGLAADDPNRIGMTGLL